MKKAALRPALVLGVGCAVVAGPFGCERTPSGGSGDAGAHAGAKPTSKLTGPRPPIQSAGRVAMGRSDGAAGTGGDPGWRDVTWAPGCAVQVAAEPLRAVPTLEWGACDGVAGCERLVVNWVSSINVPFQIASVYKRNGVLRLSIHMWFDAEWRKAVFADARTPIAAWRGPFGEAGQCGGLFIATTTANVCLLMAKVGTPTRQVVLPLDDPSGNPTAAFDTNATDSDGCTDQLFAGVAGDGADFVLDIASAGQHDITPPTGTVFGLRPYADMAFFTRFDATGSKEVLDGWVWSQGVGPRRIITPEGDNMVYDVRGDGTAVAWLEMPFTRDYNDLLAGELWTSPFSTDEPGITKRRLGTVPQTSIWPGGKALNDGHYALVEQREDPEFRQMPHVYRLSDGRHWSVPVPPDLEAGSVLYLDHEEVWYDGLHPAGGMLTIVRQRLSALGSGD